MHTLSKRFAKTIIKLGCVEIFSNLKTYKRAKFIVINKKYTFSRNLTNNICRLSVRGILI
jgi:hypothetical protein